MEDYLKEWPGGTGISVLKRAEAVLNPQQFPGFEYSGMIVDSLPNPPHRHVTAQLMNIEGLILKYDLERCRLSPQEMLKMNQFVGAYTGFALDMIAAGEELYRKTNRIPLDKVLSGRGVLPPAKLTLLFESIEHGAGESVMENAARLREDPRGLRLAGYLCRSITPPSYGFVREKDLRRLFREADIEVSRQVGQLYAQERYIKLLPFLGRNLNITGIAPAEKAK